MISKKKHDFLKIFLKLLKMCCNFSESFPRFRFNYVQAKDKKDDNLWKSSCIN